jgi:transposase
LTRFRGTRQAFNGGFSDAQDAPPYSPEFRRQMVDLVRAGRDPADFAREFEPTAQSISHWVAQADRQEGRREEKGGGLTAAERDELARLRRENKQLRLERDILSRAAAWFLSPLIIKEFALDIPTFGSGFQIWLSLGITGLYVWPWLADRRCRRNRFATDSPLEGNGFEPLVPRRESPGL